jgi:hypothetical protein
MIKILGILTLTLATGILHAQDSTQFMNAHVVIADTSSDYYKLRAQMFELSKKLDFKIGTLGRGFDDEHKILCLPKDSDDDIYAGSYFPRRFSSESLSIEYLDYYRDGGLHNSGSFALVCAITGNIEKAKKVKSKISPHSGMVFILPSRIYIDCMH